MGLGQRSLQINNLHSFFSRIATHLGGRTKMSNGPKELNFQLIKVEMALESGKIHQGRELQAWKWAEISLLAPFERDMPAGNAAYTEQAEDVLTQQAEHCSYRKLPLPCRNPKEGVCLLKIFQPAASQDEATRCVRCCLVRGFACICVCCWGCYLGKAFLKVVGGGHNTAFWQIFLTPSQTKTSIHFLVAPQKEM